MTDKAKDSSKSTWFLYQQRTFRLKKAQISIKKANFGKILGNFSEMNFKEGYFKGISI